MSDAPSPSPSPSPSPTLTASARAALCVLEELQLSGERDMLKERVQRELNARGWHEAMHAKAAEIANARMQSGGPPLTAKQLAEQLSQFGRESVPEPVRAALMADLLQAARTFATKSAAASDVADRS